MIGFAQLVASGQIALGIAVLTMGEIVMLAIFGRRAGLALASLLPNILAGDFLLLAWYFSAAHWSWAALSLTGALAAHVTDLTRRARVR